MDTAQSAREQLLQWIERSKLNQLEAARKIGIDPTQLNHILKGKRRPGLDNAVLIEAATGIVAKAWVSFDVDSDERQLVGASRKGQK